MFRRTPELVASWDGLDFRVRNYATRSSVSLQAWEWPVLHALGRWSTVDELRREFPRVGKRRLVSLLARLRARGVVESSDEPPSRARRALVSWADWTPTAASFHFETKDVAYADPKEASALLAEFRAFEPAPEAVKQVRGPTVRLPDFPRRGAFPSVLTARRSWRRFGRGSVTLPQMAALLGLTWGTQRWLHVGATRLALKTSPSGGACHSLEAYVVAMNVDGLRPGVYHYGPDTHTLTRLEKKLSAGWLERCLSGQYWFTGSAAVVFMTSVFPRVQWKYRFPRAYRVVLLEAGHFCQTFCLTATWLGLAPFCTAALADTMIERGLGIDGVTESVLYAMGVGTRPSDTAWAPWPGRSDTPPTSLPAHRIRRRRDGGASARQGRPRP